MSSENTLKKKVLKYLNSLEGCKAVKNHGSIYSERGRPDIDVCRRGQYSVIELKNPGGHATPIQLRRIREYAKAGAKAHIVDNMDRIKQLYPENDTSQQ